MIKQPLTDECCPKVTNPQGFGHSVVFALSFYNMNIETTKVTIFWRNLLFFSINLHIMALFIIFALDFKEIMRK